MISNNLNVGLLAADCSIYTRCINLKVDYRKNRMDMLVFTPVEFNTLEILAKHSSFLLDKTISSKKTFSRVLQLVGLLLQGLKNLLSLYFTLKIDSSINISISHKLEHSEVFCQF